MERLTTAAPHSTQCADCAADLEHCHETSIEHADGFTECLDPACNLHHGLHLWQASCSVLDPPCACTPEELDLDATVAPALGVAA
jgi:hypothetical protein